MVGRYHVATKRPDDGLHMIEEGKRIEFCERADRDRGVRLGALVPVPPENLEVVADLEQFLDHGTRVVRVEKVDLGGHSLKHVASSRWRLPAAGRTRLQARRALEPGFDNEAVEWID